MKQMNKDIFKAMVFMCSQLVVSFSITIWAICLGVFCGVSVTSWIGEIGGEMPIPSPSGGTIPLDFFRFILGAVVCVLIIIPVQMMNKQIVIIRYKMWLMLNKQNALFDSINEGYLNLLKKEKK